MNLEEMQKYANALSEIRVKCNCSHTLYFPAYGPDVQIRSHCGHKVYKNDRIKFKDKCDLCGKFDILKGYNGKCLCPKCIEKGPQENCSPLPRKNEKQLSIFDLEVMSRGN